MQKASMSFGSALKHALNQVATEYYDHALSGLKSGDKAVRQIARRELREADSLVWTVAVGELVPLRIR